MIKIGPILGDLKVNYKFASLSALSKGWSSPYTDITKDMTYIILMYTAESGGVEISFGLFWEKLGF